MRSLLCAECGVLFVPKALGYNAKYCSMSCKDKDRYKRRRKNDPEYYVAARRRAFLQTKTHPDRYENHMLSSRRGKKSVRQWLAEYKLKHGCVDCGYKEHSAALQLDHEGPKTAEIANCRSSVKRLLAEIESGQCKVRCANCHSIKTWERKQKPVEPHVPLGPKLKPILRK